MGCWEAGEAFFGWMLNTRFQTFFLPPTRPFFSSVAEDKRRQCSSFTTTRILNSPRWRTRSLWSSIPRLCVKCNFIDLIQFLIGCGVCQTLSGLAGCWRVSWLSLGDHLDINYSNRPRVADNERMIKEESRGWFWFCCWLLVILMLSLIIADYICDIDMREGSPTLSVLHYTYM